MVFIIYDMYLFTIRYYKLDFYVENLYICKQFNKREKKRCC